MHSRREIKRKARFYDETARLYDRRYKVQQSLKHSVALSEVPISKCDVVADFGCGTGDLSKRIKNACNTCVSIDFSLKMLLEAKRKYFDLDLILADVHYIPLKEKAINKFFAITLLQNINETVFFEELSRVCRPGSKGIVSTLSKKARVESPFRRNAEKLLEIDEDTMLLVEIY